MTTTFRRTVAILLICGLQEGWSVNLQQRQTTILNTILHPDKYDVRVRPLNDSEISSPTVAHVNMFVRMLNKIDDVKMQYHMQITLRQQWMDSRLKFDDLGGKIKYLQFFEMGRLWTPDLFFSNENSGFINDLMKPNIYFRIFPSGNVLFSARVSLVLSCPMNLKRFPFDRQVCSMRMASYGYTSDDVIFLWKEGDPVQIVKNLQIPHYTLEQHIVDYCNSKTNTGEYSCLKVDMLFKRDVGYYLIQIFIPCAMFVIISWISFWLDIHAPLTRLFVTGGPLLVLAVILSGINAGLPVTLYTKALDIYTGTCLTFIFAALMEFAILDYTSRRCGKKQSSAPGVSDSAMDEENGTAFDMPLVDSPAVTAVPRHASPSPGGRIANYYNRWVSKLPKGPKKIDVISRLGFPIGFALFNIYYWITNLFF